MKENLQSSTRGHRRIYISREDAAIRRCLNEHEVTACFERHGFETCTLARLSFAAQRALISDASHIAGLHGAGLANMVFAGMGASVMELMPPNNGSFAYWVMASAIGLRYRLLTVDDAWLGIGPSPSFDLTLNFRDCRVDIDRLDRALTDFVVER